MPPCAVVGVGAGLVEVAADRERRVEPAVLQRHRQHRGGRRLAVGAGHARDAVARHQRGERLGAVQHGQPARLGGDQLGVVRLDRGGHHDRRRAAVAEQVEVRRRLADRHPGALRAQRQQAGDSFASEPDTCEPAVEQDAGDAAHPGTPDADEVRRARAGRGSSLTDHLEHHASQHVRRLAVAGALRAAALMAASRCGSVSSGTTSSATRSGVSSSSITMSAATGVHHRPRVQRLLAVADRQRHEHRGQARPPTPRRRSSHRSGTAPRRPPRRRGPCAPGTARRRTAARPATSCTAREFFGPCACSTPMPASAKRRRARGHRVVDRAGTLRAAEHQQRRRVGVQAEVLAGLRTQRRPVQRDDRLAQRDADDLGLGQARVRHGDRDPLGEARRRPCSRGPTRALESCTTIGTRPRAAR